MKRKLSILCALALLLAACNGVPSRIIQPEEMAQLMADVHMGEAVIDRNSYEFYTDSSRQALKQSVYLKHGVTAAQVDSSLAWYGRNINHFMKVYDRTIEILEGRRANLGALAYGGGGLGGGDSLDLWTMPSSFSITDRSPSHVLSFNVEADSSSRRGDEYRWSAKVTNPSQDARWTIAAEYADGTMEYFSRNIAQDGRAEISLVTDTSRVPERIYGSIVAANKPGYVMYVDSVRLVRHRMDNDRYGRRYMLHRLPVNLKPQLKKDTVAVDSTILINR